MTEYDRFSEIHAALLDIVTVLNRPQGDEALIEAAGISLPPALFRVLVGIQRFGPIGVVELADRLGRDHSTASRQIAQLEQLGLVSRRTSRADRRLREVALTPRGSAMAAAIDTARRRIGESLLASWDPADVDTLARLLGRFASIMKTYDAGR